VRQPPQDPSSRRRQMYAANGPATLEINFLQATDRYFVLGTLCCRRTWITRLETSKRLHPVTEYAIPYPDSVHLSTNRPRLAEQVTYEGDPDTVKKSFYTNFPNTSKMRSNLLTDRVQ
jgi:hypothetical protein